MDGYCRKSMEGEGEGEGPPPLIGAVVPLRLPSSFSLGGAPPNEILPTALPAGERPPRRVPNSVTALSGKKDTPSPPLLPLLFYSGSKLSYAPIRRMPSSNWALGRLPFAHSLIFIPFHATTVPLSPLQLKILAFTAFRKDKNEFGKSSDGLRRRQCLLPVHR